MPFVYSAIRVKAMKTNQAWGWLAAGVLAAGLNASYYDGAFQWAHQIAERVGYRSAAVLAEATGRADQFLAEAQLLAARNESASCPLTGALARVETGLAPSHWEFERFEAMSARQQAQLTRLEANRARMEAQIQARTLRLRIQAANFVPVDVKAIPAPVVCPRVRVNIPKMPMIKMPVAPEIHIEMPGNGPV